MSSAVPPARTPQVASAQSFLILVLSSALFCATTACERAGEVPRDSANRSTAARGAEVVGFVVGQVAVASGPRTEQPVDVVTDAEIGRRVRQQLLELDGLHEEPWQGPRVDFRLTWTLGLGSAEPPRAESPTSAASTRYLVLYLDLVGEAAEDHRFEFEFHGIYRERIGDGETQLQAGERLIAEGITDVITGLDHDVTAICSSDEQLLQMLTSGPISADRLLPVIRQVHRRQLHGAAPGLRALLETEDLELLLGVIAALGRLRDAEAVDPLIELISRRHRQFTEQVLPVLGEIGSLEARRYLETVATGHESEVVQRLAREVIEDYWGRRTP